MTHKDKTRQLLKVGAYADNFGFDTQNVVKLSTCSNQQDKELEVQGDRISEKMEGKVLFREILGSDTSTPAGMAKAIHDDMEKNIAFIQFDIKRFKIINDLYGERFGDKVLFYVNEKLREICTGSQIFANLRSDVFMVVTEYDKEQDVFDFIDKLEEEISSYKEVKIQFVFGIYFVEDKDMEFRRMEDRAAMARKYAKSQPSVNKSVYQQQFKDKLYTRKFVEDNMKAAIEEKQFKMFIQPKYNIFSGKIVGAEALVRWFNPERGVIYPNVFIPIIEENGFVKKVDYFIWNEACDLVKRCREIGIDDCPISVNVSRQHLQDSNFIGELDKDISETDIDKKLLQLEITETADDKMVGQMVNKLKDKGFTLLMDDFGSGYSSLNFLLENPFDVIKLDKKFVDNMLTSEKGRIILEYVVAMARTIGIGVMAEGVETFDQVEFLKNIGCDEVQGFYFAKPMPKEDFFEMIKKERGKN